MIDSNLVPAPVWLAETGPDSDVVLATRCRYARNFAGLPFPHHASAAARNVVWSRATILLKPMLPGARLEILDQLMDSEVLQHLAHRRIGPALLQSGAGAGIIGAADGHISVQVNEEDHLRVQAMLPGLQVNYAQSSSKNLVRLVDDSGLTASHPVFGSLAASPSNCGTGMRLGVFVQLLALQQSGQLTQALDAVWETGCSVRGAWGERTGTWAGLYQVSLAQVGTQPESYAVARIESAVERLVRLERQTREHFRPFVKSAALEPDVQSCVECVSTARCLAGMLDNQAELVRRTGQLAELTAWQAFQTLGGCEPKMFAAQLGDIHEEATLWIREHLSG